MDADRFHRLIRGEIGGPGGLFARAGLRAASVGYGAAVRFRNRPFDRGRGVHRAAVPVVSIGNLTVGGTGKTPMVEYVCRAFRDRGLRVAILSRGYGSGGGLNDEGQLLDENLPDVPHLQHPDRVDLARIAVEEFESQILVLDDGFQHRRLGRDLDIVLLDALEPFGHGHLLPRGLLREPLDALRRADLVVLSRANLISAERRNAIRTSVERRCGPIPWAEACHAPRDLLKDGGDPEPIDSIKGRRIVAFCGLGNPEGFRRTLLGLGLEPIDFRTFPDHHPYRRADVESLVDWARSSGAALALTTQKDSVKLCLPSLGPVPLRALRIGIEVLEGAESLDDALGRVASAAVGLRPD